MARVPTYSELQVGANTLPNARVDAPSTAGIGGIAARQMQETGDALQQGGELAGRMAVDLQQQANQVQIDSALNRVKEEQLRLTYDKEAGYSSVMGEAAFKRKSGKSLADDYSEELQKRIASISAELGNDAQRAAFGQHASNMVLSLRQNATAHEADQFKTHSLSVAEGIQATALRDIGLNWNNPEAVNAAVERIRAQTYEQARLLGKSGEWQEAQARKMTSNGHRLAAMTALENSDPAYANAYLSKYADKMEADDLLQVRGHVTREMNQQIGVKQADQVFAKFAPKLMSGPMETLMEITVGSESGGRQFAADGTPMTSAKGAIGIAQVMPATAPEAAKLAGLPWDEYRYKNDPEYNKALGRAYLQKQLQDFGGDPAKAWAAYNAGPGALRKALEKEKSMSERLAKPGEDLISGKPATIDMPHGWLNYMPEETRKYVVKNTALLEKAQKGGAVIAKPTEQDLHAALAEDPLLAANPEAMKVAMAQVRQRHSDFEATLKQRGEEVKAAAQQALIANGGRWNELSPDLRAQITQYIPGEVDSLKKFNGNPETNWGLYYDLKRDPKSLEIANLAVMRDQLGDAEFKNLIEEQQDLRSGKVSSTTQLRSTHDYVQQLMVQSGLNPTSKDKGEAEKVGKVWATVETRIRQQETAAGRKLTQAEAQTEIAKLFTNVEVHRSWWANADVPALAVGETDRVVVPPADYKTISDLLKQQGRPVDEITVANYYRRSLGAPEFKGKN